MGVLMSFTWRLCLTLVCLFLGTCIANATSTSDITVPCPICEAEVGGEEIMSTNSLGGGDIDYCPHPRGTPTIPISMWSCEKCGFTGYLNEFRGAFTPEELKHTRDWLAAELPPASYPREPWEKYDVAARLAIFRQAAAEDIGFLYLRAAWCCRYGRCDHAASDLMKCRENNEFVLPFLPDFFGRLQRLELQNPAINEDPAPYPAFVPIAEKLYLENPPAGEEAQASALLLAGLFRTHGEHERTLFWLDTLERLSPAPGVLDEIRSIRASIARERGFQTKVIEYFEKALKSGKLAPDRQLRLSLIIADSLRRLARPKDAEILYRQVLAAPGLPEDVEQGAAFGMKLVGKDYSPTAERQKELRLQRQEQFFTDLHSPGDKGDNAASQLARNPDPACIPRLLELLESPDEVIQQRAMTALVYDDPRVIEAMVARLDQPHLIDSILSHCINLGKPEVLPFLLPLFKKELKSWTRRSLVNALTSIGGTEVTTALVAESRVAFASDLLTTYSAYGTPESGHIHYCSNLAEALGVCDDETVLEPLSLLLAKAHEEFLARSAGQALEYLTNNHFGFCGFTPYEPADKEHVGEKPIEEAKQAWQNWLSVHRSDGLAAWVRAGFENRGYSVYPASNPVCLDELIRGLTDTADFIRYHSWMELYQRTGVAFDRDKVRPSSILHERFPAIALKYRTWLDQRRGSLVWDASLKRFRGEP